jgi:hypothetical protein
MKETHNLDVYDTLVTVESERSPKPASSRIISVSSNTSMPAENSRSSHRARDSGHRRETEHSRDTSSAERTTPDLEVFVQDLLEQMVSVVCFIKVHKRVLILISSFLSVKQEARFSLLEKSINGKLSAMGEQMDELDGAIANLMAEAGLDPPSEDDDAKPNPKFDIPVSSRHSTNVNQSSDSRVVL